MKIKEAIWDILNTIGMTVIVVVMILALIVLTYDVINNLIF